MSERAVIATMMSVTEIAHAGHVAVTVGAVLAAVAAVIAVVVADVVEEHHVVADGNHFFRQTGVSKKAGSFAGHCMVSTCLIKKILTESHLFIIEV